MKLNIKVFLFLLLFGVLGYFREFFFVQINNILYQKYYGTETTLPVASVMKVFQFFSYSNLYYSKYLFTIFWAVLFYFFNLLAIKTLSKNIALIKFLNYGYLILFILAAISMAYGILINNHMEDSEYTLSRWLLGIAQSPIICLILLASEKLYNTQIHDNKKG